MTLYIYNVIMYIHYSLYMKENIREQKRQRQRRILCVYEYSQAYFLVLTNIFILMLKFSGD